MRRILAYSQQVPSTSDILNTNRNVLMALGQLAQDIFGPTTCVSGLACSPSTPAALSVQIGLGRMYSPIVVDATAYSDLGTDTADTIVKQAALLAPVTLSTPAPIVAGQSIAYLIEAQYVDQDGANQVLPYYNNANPLVPLSGANGLGVAQPTVRDGTISLVVKAGVSATTGTQVTPTADTGYTGLWVVTVAFGAASVVSGNIVQFPGAPFLTFSALTALTQTNADLRYLQQYFRTAAEIAAGVTPTAFQFVPGDVRRYGGDPLGVTPADTAWASNVAQASQTGGAEMTGPGTYLLSTGIVIAANGARLRTAGMGPTTFKANANNIILIKVAASYCHIGDFNVDANGHTGVEGLTLAPVNEADTTHLTQITFNVFGAIQLFNGLKEGIRMRAGPTVGGVDSGVFYNTFEGVWMRDCIRGIWMQDTIGGGLGESNRNTFLAVRAGSSGFVINTGIQIDSGSTNKFFGADFEGIQNGVTPNATPTAVKIVNTGANGVDNNDNHFFGCFMEANTRDLDNTNSSTVIIGGAWRDIKIACGTVISTITNVGTTATVTTATAHGLASNQRVRMKGQTAAAYAGVFLITVTGPTTFTYPMLTNPGGAASVVGTFDVPVREMRGLDPSLAPSILPGMMYGEGLLGYPSSYWGMLKEIADLNLNWQAYALTTGIMTNVATIGASASQFRQLANMVSWHASFTFNASVAGTQVTITPPVTPNAALYSTLLANNAYYSFYVEDGTGIRKAVEAGWTSTGKLYVKAPAAWNTAGNNNAIFIAIEYHL